MSWRVGLWFSVIALALSGCGEKPGAEAVDESAPAPSAVSDSENVTEAPEPIAEETPEIRSGDPADDDVEFIYRLGLIRGHLLSFIELYRAEAYETAAAHVQHPGSELYDALVPAFEARASDGFAGGLNALADASAERGDVNALYADLVVAIRATAPKTSVAVKLLAISKMVATAAEEFEAGVAEDGAITDAHEYQDAFGFLSVAREMLASENSSDINEAEAIAVAHEQLDLSINAFAGLLAEATEGQAETIYAAAAQIERAALRLQ
ncbi:MAG: hypothetical protein GXP06_10240 [Alphaproteobacteria bacterium]|nr:hypothetical protein [Alphaproteobacteria bacterium]